MKKTLRGIFSILMVMILMSSCVRDIMHESVQMDGIVTYTAYSDAPETKTVLQERTTLWKGEEWIQVVGRNGNYWFNTNTSGATAQATFTYNGGNGEFKEDDVFAIYPAGSANYGKDFENMSVSGVTIPSNQNAVAGSYDPNAAVAIAYSTDDDLKFKNAHSLLKFTMGSDGIKNVTIWGDMKEVPGEGVPSFVQDGYVYMTVHNDWRTADARFAAYFWADGKDAVWVDMTAVSGEQNMFSCAIPAGMANVIFCRMNPAVSTNGWDKDAPLWNQTVDLKLADGNHFVMSNPWDNAGSEGKAIGAWESFSGVSYLGISGTGKVHYNDGSPVFEGASNGYVSLNGDFKKGKTYYMVVAPVVFEKGFTVEFSYSGDYDKFAVKSTTKKVEFKRNTIHDLGTIRSNKETGFFTKPAVPNADQACTIYYRPAEGDEFVGYTGDLYAHVWVRNGAADSNGSKWGDNNAKYKFTKVAGESNLWSLEMAPSVREWFGIDKNSPCWKIGIIARSSDSKTQTGDSFLKVQDDRHPSPEMPEGLQHGINYIDNSTVTLVLYDRDNQGKSYDFCNLLWDENWWGDSSKPKKPLAYDDESGCWWITLTGLNPNKQYKFQYQLGKGSDVWVTTFDPYTEIVYDRSNDQWISDYAYPNLSAEYGDSHYGRDNGFVSAFKINKDIYNWKYADYQIEDKDDLIIYELLVRDFTDNSYGEGCLNAIMDREWESGKNWLDYLQNLGVNAIELMPIQEFEGNNSWGYGNHAYFAMDKAYGNRATVKKFIDECHKRGMAVLLDVVYNHATGAHPYAAMYWNLEGRTASNNPWFNEYATHPYNVYHQWNHANPMVRDHVKQSLEYLIREYKVDGFRFDLTKGFMGTSSNVDGYNQERVNYLKEYAAHIRYVDANAVMICEHFVDDENYELSKEGIKVWRNMNHSYIKAMKRDMSQADFSGTVGGYNLVSYMESHDEERTNFEGQWSYNGSDIPFATRMERAKLNAAFFLLSPGPRMIWQFGEIGYDISINDGDRVDKKPYKAPEYLKVAERKALYDTYSMLLKFRKDNPRFFDSDVNFRWYVGSGEQKGRYLFSKSAEGKHYALFGNFGTGTQEIGVSLPAGVSKWYQYDSGAEWNGSSHTVSMAEGQFYLLVSDKSMCRK